MLNENRGNPPAEGMLTADPRKAIHTARTKGPQAKCRRSAIDHAIAGSTLLQAELAGAGPRIQIERKRHSSTAERWRWRSTLNSTQPKL
jgi:hypothetical protein